MPALEGKGAAVWVTGGQEAEGKQQRQRLLFPNQDSKGLWLAAAGDRP